MKNVAIKRGNLSLTVRNFSVKSRKRVCKCSIYRVNGKNLGICSRKTKTCFLTSGYSLTDNYFRCIGSCVRISHVDSEWSSGSQTSLTSFCRFICSRSEFYLRNSVYITTFRAPNILDPVYLGARDLVIMVEGGRRSYTRRGQNGLGSVSRGAGMVPTRRTDRCDLRYGLDQSLYLLPAFSSNNCLLT